MKTLFVGQNCIHLKSIDSTNSYASQLMGDIKPVEGTLIYTFEQQNGRGQRGNTWESEPNKNVASSFILHPSFLHVNNQFTLTKIISLAVADVMAELLKPSDKTSAIRIKWPNDIYVGTKKIAGILIENTLRESYIQHSIIGIGINCNQLKFNAGINATSVALINHQETDLMLVIEKLSECIEARYLQLKASKLESIDAAYLAQLYQFNKWHNYTAGNQFFEGKIIGISAIGKLQVELKTTETKEFDLKEIKFV